MVKIAYIDYLVKLSTCLFYLKFCLEVKESEETSAVKRKRSTNVTLTFSPNKRHRKSLKGPGQQSVFSGTDSSDNGN